MNTRIQLLSVIFFISLSFSSFCQQSMIPEISSTYLQKLIDTAKKYYPRMQAYQHAIASAQKGVSKAKLSWFDVLTFTWLYSPNNSTTLTDPALLNGYQFGVYFNLGSILTKKPTIDIAKENFEIAKLDKKEYELNIEAIVKARYYTYVGQLTILRLRTQSASDAEASLKDVKYKYEKGEESFDAYSKALVNYSSVTEDKIEAESAVFIAKSSLEEIVVKKLEEIN